MTIEERLKKLEYLAGIIVSVWFDITFFEKEREDEMWWKFSEIGATKRNLINANDFWRELYREYREGNIVMIFAKRVEDARKVIKELEMELK